MQDNMTCVIENLKVISFNLKQYAMHIHPDNEDALDWAYNLENIADCIYRDANDLKNKIDIIGVRV